MEKERVPVMGWIGCGWLGWAGLGDLGSALDWRGWRGCLGSALDRAWFFNRRRIGNVARLE